jgi:hypothetical protein
MFCLSTYLHRDPPGLLAAQAKKGSQVLEDRTASMEVSDRVVSVVFLGLREIGYSQHLK